MEHQTPNRREGRQPDYMKYSGMAIQMGIVILIGVYLGKRLDAHFQTRTPWWTVALSLISIAAALYLATKDLIKRK